MPDAEVHFLTREAYRSVTELNPYIDKFFYLKEKLPLVIMELKREQYDFVIDLHNNLRSYRVKRALKKKIF